MNIKTIDSHDSVCQKVCLLCAPCFHGNSRNDICSNCSSLTQEHLKERAELGWESAEHAAPADVCIESLSAPGANDGFYMQLSTLCGQVFRRGNKPVMTQSVSHKAIPLSLISTSHRRFQEFEAVPLGCGSIWRSASFFKPSWSNDVFRRSLKTSVLGGAQAFRRRSFH